MVWRDVPRRGRGYETPVVQLFTQSGLGFLGRSTTLPLTCPIGVPLDLLRLLRGCRVPSSSRPGSPGVVLHFSTVYFCL